MEQNNPQQIPANQPNQESRVPPVVQPQMPKSSRMFLVPVIIAVVLLLLGVGAGYLLFDKSSDKIEQEHSATNNLSAEVTKQQSLPANWKTYKNTSIWYELDYPPTWQVGITQGGSIQIVNPLRSGREDTDTPIEHVTIQSKSNTLPCEGSNWKIGFGNIYYKAACLNEKVFMTMAAFDTESKELEDRILSSFRFICKNGATNYPHCNADLPLSDAQYKTYRNEKYGFEFQYPDDAIVTMNTYRQSVPPPGEDRFVVEFPSRKIEGPPGHILFYFSVIPTQLNNNSALLTLKRKEIADNPNVRDKWTVSETKFFNLNSAIVITEYPQNGFSIGCKPTYTLSEGVLYVSSGYLFSFNDYRCSGYPQEARDVMNTFKFIDSTSLYTPTVAVLSPNGGETFSVGQKMEVKWSARNINGGLMINLIDSNGSIVSPTITGLGVSGPDLTSWPGTYSLTIPSVPTGKYKIKIETYGKNPSLVSDLSDGYFNIK